VHHSTFLHRKSNNMQQFFKIFIVIYLSEAHRVSGDTSPIIRNLKLHKQPLVLHNAVGGCWTCS
jgi:hypothetical protein